MLPSFPHSCSLAIALLTLSRAALAQGGAREGTIGGRVLDDAGQPVRHARVVARDVRTGAERAATALTRQVVTATRSAVSIAAVPGAVTVVSRERIEEQARAAPRLGPMLVQLVPGLGAATENLSNFGQNSRGRAVLVLIGGVPQSTSRNVSRDFVNIDPAMVERVEVVRGATSVYGKHTGAVIDAQGARVAPRIHGGRVDVNGPFVERRS